MIFKYCPVCSSQLIYTSKEGEQIPVCQNPDCGFIFWQNSKPCASVIIADNQDNLLMTVRKHEPEKGKLDLPGGFLREGEHPDDGAKREIQEELGVEIKIRGYIGFVVDQYGQDGEY